MRNAECGTRNLKKRAFNGAEKLFGVRVAWVSPNFCGFLFSTRGISWKPTLGSGFSNRFSPCRGGSRTARRAAGLASEPTECGMRNAEFEKTRLHGRGKIFRRSCRLGFAQFLTVSIFRHVEISRNPAFGSGFGNRLPNADCGTRNAE